jgi:hypothetical protein
MVEVMLMSSTQDFATTYNRLPVSEKALLLAKMAHKLTICARESYAAAAGTIVDFERLKAFNETQHRIAGQLLAILSDSPITRSDDVFIDMIIKNIEYLGCTQTLVGLLIPQSVQ